MQHGVRNSLVQRTHEITEKLFTVLKQAMKICGGVMLDLSALT